MFVLPVLGATDARLSGQGCAGVKRRRVWEQLRFPCAVAISLTNTQAFTSLHCCRLIKRASLTWAGKRGKQAWRWLPGGVGWRGMAWQLSLSLASSSRRGGVLAEGWLLLPACR